MRNTNERFYKNGVIVSPQYDGNNSEYYRYYNDIKRKIMKSKKQPPILCRV